MLPKFVQLRILSDSLPSLLDPAFDICVMWMEWDGKAESLSVVVLFPRFVHE